MIILFSASKQAAFLCNCVSGSFLLQCNTAVKLRSVHTLTPLFVIIVCKLL